MPPSDPTFLRDRVANTWLRSIGIPGLCATSATLAVNGAPYGLYVAEGTWGTISSRVLPGNSEVTSSRAGGSKTNTLPPAGPSPDVLGRDDASRAHRNRRPPGLAAVLSREAMLSADGDSTMAGTTTTSTTRAPGASSSPTTSTTASTTWGPSGRSSHLVVDAPTPVDRATLSRRHER